MPPPSNRRPFPDVAHENLARWVEETVADLGDSLLLVDVLFGLSDSASARGKESHGLAARVADLEARLAALEPAVFTPEETPSAD